MPKYALFKDGKQVGEPRSTIDEVWQNYTVEKNYAVRISYDLKPYRYGYSIAEVSDA